MQPWAYVTLKPERDAARLARLQRWRAAGWMRFTFVYSILVALVIALATSLILGFVNGFGFATRLSLVFPPLLLSTLMGSQWVWWVTIPVTIEELEDPDLGRRALRREGFCFFFAGILAAFAANFIPFHLGRAALVPDLMLTVTGLVVSAWGIGKLQRYWRTSANWPQRSFMARVIRSYGLIPALLLPAVLFSLRIYACYGEATWAEPIRRMVD